MERTYQMVLSKLNVNKTIEFHLAKDYQNIEISLELEDKLRFKCFLRIADPGNIIRLQREVSHGELRYIIGGRKDNTSIGGIPGPIMRGSWKCSLYCMYENFNELFQEPAMVTLRFRCNTANTPPDHIGEESWTDYDKEKDQLTLSEYDEARCYSDQERWYAGDFHTHTRLSDGKCSVKEAMQIAAEQKLDFYVTTEHNLIHTGFEAAKTLVIPGIEVTTEFGHLNCFGIRELPKEIQDIFLNPSDQVKTEKAVLAIMERNREKGYINSLNHPFLYPWSWELFNIPIHLFDTIEIENDPTYDNAAVSNELALKLFYLLWEDGHKVYAIGGSDAHNLVEERYDNAILPSIIGDPRTVVYSEELSPKAILAHVKSGHSCVSRFIELVPVITLRFDGETKEYSYLPGECLPEACTCRPYFLEYTIHVTVAEEIMNCKLMVNGRQVQVQEIDPGTAKIHFTYRGDASPYQWIHIEIRNAKGEFIGIANPVYAGKKESRYHTYQEMQALIVTSGNK